MEIDRFVLLIFYSAYSRSENDARIEKSARLIFTPNHPGPYTLEILVDAANPLFVSTTRASMVTAAPSTRNFESVVHSACAESDLLTTRLCLE